ncbi:MAG: hypothetical protein D6711_01235 [Chloroflexi bacterium]|nr:MAG: hypothetical protein D6711_01235 [Chloroflexota bacterium]
MEHNRGISLIIMIALIITMLLMFLTQLRTQNDLNNTQTTLTAQFNGMNATSTQNAAEVAALRTESAQQVLDVRSEMQTAVVNVVGTVRADAIQSANATATLQAQVYQTAQADAVSQARVEGMDIAQGTLMPVISTLQSQSENYSATLSVIATQQAIIPSANVNANRLSYNQTFDTASSWRYAGARVQNGELILRTSYDGGTVSTINSELSFAAGYLEVHIDTRNCPPTTLAGLIYAQTYLFLVSCDGQSWVAAKYTDDQYQVLDFGLSQPSSIQTLGIMLENAMLTVYINGEPISNLLINVLDNQTVGFYLMAEHEAIVYFDNLRVWQ